MKKKQKQKYDLGSYVTNPNSDLAENQIAIVKAMLEGGNNSWAKGLNIGGNLATQIGQGLIQNGINKGQGSDGKGIEGFLNKYNDSIFSGINGISGLMNMFALGGQIANIPVEVEDKEIGETPDGQLLEFKGASHEQGGINVNLPENTNIFSKRIKIDGVSMADRKKKREKKEFTLQELLDSDPTDILVKNSLERTKETNQIQENEDNNIQNILKNIVLENKYATGGPITPLKENKDYSTNPWQNEENNPVNNFLTNFNSFISGLNPKKTNNDVVPYSPGSFDPVILKPKDIQTTEIDLPKTLDNQNPIIDERNEKKPFNLSDYTGDISLGDMIGLMGNYISTFKPMQNTLENRAGDTPNVNSFSNYGKDGLDVIDSMKKYVNQIRDEKLKDLELSRNSSIRSNRNLARSINQQRALDAYTDSSINDVKEKTYSSFAEQMMNILSNQAQMENQQDQMVMQGEAQRDLADRQDRDNFYTQLGKDISTKGFGLQETGKDINSMKERRIIENLIGNLSKYGLTIDKNGNLTNKKK